MSFRPAALLVALLLVAGFAGPAAAQNPPGPPWPVVVSPNGIALRWYPDDISEGQAHLVANAHCGATGHAAVLAGVEMDGSVELGSYRCR